MAAALLAATTTVPDVSVGHALLQMVLALAVIVVCIYGLSKLLARLRTGSARPGRRQQPGGLTVLSRQPLGKEVSIATVKWGEREVLVGIAGSTITFLNDARPDDAGTPLVGELPAPGGERSAVPCAAGTDHGGLPALLLAAARQHDAAEPAPRRQSLVDSLRSATLRR